MLVDTMFKRPGGTLPEKLSDPPDLRALYRILNAPDVTHATLLVSHFRATREAMMEAVEQGATVLIVHDATELDYSKKKTLWDQLGQIGQGTHRGYICHNSLAVRADTRTTLGLTSQILHHRADVPKKEKAKARREREDRESRLWPRGAQQSGRLPTGLVVDVSDSLSDTFEYMAYECTSGRNFVLRSRENRGLVEPINGNCYLWDGVRSKMSLVEKQLRISATAGRKAGVATLRMSLTPIVLDVPGKRTGDYAEEPLPMWAVRVWEPHPPDEEDPLEWILLTNVETVTVEQALERVSWYEARFTIEEFHKGMKTGCGIEPPQFKKLNRLEPAIAVLSVLTTLLLQLRDTARQPGCEERLASDVVGEGYIEVLKACYPKRLHGNISVKTFYMHVARLGGHQNRKCDGNPGWLTLWRGWMKLEDIVRGYRAGQRKRRKTCGNN